MKKILSAALLVVALGSCSTAPKFTVEGNINDAKDKTLYFEASRLDGIQILDSIKLNDKGSFTFKGQQPESPDFYRLRLDDKVINFSIDSTETITIDAPYAEMSTAYNIYGSENSEKIKELTLKQMELQSNINILQAALRSNQLPYSIFEDRLEALIKNYKDDVKMNYIFTAPQSASAYFALFQKANNYLIFDPFNSKDDNKCFAAVATSLNHNYPHALRSKNLYNIAIKGMQNTRNRDVKPVEVPEDKVNEIGVIDINLRDAKGNYQKLSDLKGKVVLLDFTIFQTQQGAAHNLMLKDLYNKYAAQGLEIYQVSLDADEHFWKTSAINSPWVSVHDQNGIYSTNAMLYNIKQVPSFFLINRNNELKLRDEEIKDIDQAIKSLL